MKKIKKFFTSKGTKHGTIAILMTVIFIAAVVVLNVIANIMVEKVPALSVDLTSNKMFEMQKETINYIEGIKDEVNIYVLMSESEFKSNGDYFLQSNNLLKQFEQHNKKIKLSYVDLISNPNFTSKYEKVDWTSSDNMILVESGSDYRAIPTSEMFVLGVDYNTYSQFIENSNVEQAVTTAILNVVNKEKVKYAFISGLGEEGTEGITKLLENNAYEKVETNLATMDIDPECSFAILFSPHVDLDKEAAEKIEDFLNNDGNYGKSIIYIPFYEKVNTPNIDKLLEDWNMKLSDGLVFETDMTKLINQSNVYTFLCEMEEVYKDGLKNPDIPVISAFSRGINILDESTVKPILTSSELSGIDPYEKEDDFDYSEAITGKPIAVAAVSSKEIEDGTTSNIIVFGSDQMFQEAVLSMKSYNNAAYIVNLANTISDRDDIGITIEGKAIENTELAINESTSTFLGFIFRFVLPIGILVIGLVVWISRRNK